MTKITSNVLPFRSSEKETPPPSLFFPSAGCEYHILVPLKYNLTRSILKCSLLLLGPRRLVPLFCPPPSNFPRCFLHFSIFRILLSSEWRRGRRNVKLFDVQKRGGKSTFGLSLNLQSLLRASRHIRKKVLLVQLT